MTTDSMADIRDMAFFAFRYSLGRKTFAPHMVQTFVKENLDIFHTHDLEQMAREIGEAKRFHLGDPRIDEPQWLEFREYLLDKLK